MSNLNTTWEIGFKLKDKKKFGLLLTKLSLPNYNLGAQVMGPGLKNGDSLRYQLELQPKLI